MQLVALILRLGGSVQHTVFKKEVTPAEILILREIHGDDACVDIRPTGIDKNRGQEFEWERLSTLYDRAGSLVSTPGEEHRSIMIKLFPGAMRKLPTTLEEIGLGALNPPARAPRQPRHPAEVLNPEQPQGEESQPGTMNFSPEGGEGADANSDPNDEKEVA